MPPKYLFWLLFDFNFFDLYNHRKTHYIQELVILCITQLTTISTQRHLLTVSPKFIRNSAECIRACSPHTVKSHIFSILCKLIAFTVFLDPWREMVVPIYFYPSSAVFFPKKSSIDFLNFFTIFDLDKLKKATKPKNAKNVLKMTVFVIFSKIRLYHNVELINPEDLARTACKNLFPFLKYSFTKFDCCRKRPKNALYLENRKSYWNSDLISRINNKSPFLHITSDLFLLVIFRVKISHKPDQLSCLYGFYPFSR